MLGYVPISSLPNSSSAVEFPVEILHGILRAPNLYVNGSLGVYGELEFPDLQVDGVIDTVYYLNGDLTSPELQVDGICDTVYSLEGDLYLNKLVVDGEIKEGTILEGALYLPPFSIDGDIDIPRLLAGALTSKLLIINGKIAVTLTDSVLEFSEDTTCLQ